MIELTPYARHLIDVRLSVRHRVSYLRWLDNCNLSDDDHLDILDRICNILRPTGTAQLTFPTISDYESWLIRNGLARRKAVLSVPHVRLGPANRIWHEGNLAILKELLGNGLGVNEIAEWMRMTSTQIRSAMKHHSMVRAT